MHSSTLVRFAVILLAAIALTACANKKGSKYAGVDGDYVSGTPLPDRMDGTSFLSGNVEKGQFAPVYFGFDSYYVESGEIGKLQQVADFLRGGAGTVIVAGFTDERGTEEYNRVLGERRAQAVRQWLVENGVSGGNVHTVSFGEEMPADPGSGESAWAKNRRAEFGIVR